MKKVFIIFTIFSFLATLFYINTTENKTITQKTLQNKLQNNKVIYISWPWLPMAQFDKYRPLIDITDEISKEINDENSKNKINDIINNLENNLE